MNDAPQTQGDQNSAMRRVREIKALRDAHPGMSLREAVERWEGGERASSLDYEYAWRWADKGDGDLRLFSEIFTEEDCKDWVRKNNGIAPCVLVKRPRTPWVEVPVDA